jgi:hypothetical protein
MTVRRTQSIVTDSASADPVKEADVVMTAATLGFAADYIGTNRTALHLDMDPLDAVDTAKTELFTGVVTRIDGAVARYLARTGQLSGNVIPRLSPGYREGAMIVGVYVLAGQSRPRPERGDAGSPLLAPFLTEKGRALWEQIETVSPSLRQYTGRGAYTGFVDNHNTVGDTDPVGPRSTVRMVAPAAGADGSACERWLPPVGHPLWGPRRRRDTGTEVPWGLIGGNRATEAPEEGRGRTPAGNAADQIEVEMRDRYGMAFVGQPSANEVATYTHGMIQAIYKAYALGPSCVPYEIAVGDVTKKMASCLGCTLFMHAVGYPPTSIHLGSAESWAPLYAPYNPNGPTEPNERGVVRDLNNAWAGRCRDWLAIGLDVLDDATVAAGHRSSRDAVRGYLEARATDPGGAANLILDALTIHEPEVKRLARALG